MTTDRTCEEWPKAVGLTSESTSLSTPTLPLRVFDSSSRSDVTSRCCSIPASIALASNPISQGLVRNRKMYPLFTASMAVFWSAFPVSIMRTQSGAAFLTALRNSTPFMRGICISETTTAKGPFSAIASSPSSPPGAVSIWKSFRR